MISKDIYHLPPPPAPSPRLGQYLPRHFLGHFPDRGDTDRTSCLRKLLLHTYILPNTNACTQRALQRLTVPQRQKQSIIPIHNRTGDVMPERINRVVLPKNLNPRETLSCSRTNHMRFVIPLLHMYMYGWIYAYHRRVYSR